MKRRHWHPIAAWGITLVAFLVLRPALSSQGTSGPRILLDDFESGAIRVVQPTQTDPQFRYLWNQFTTDAPNSGPGLATISPLSVSRDGVRGLKITVNSRTCTFPTGEDVCGNLYLQFYPNDGQFWRYMRQFTQPSNAWQMDTFNRMRFWIKVPPEVQLAPGGLENFQFGTYIRASTVDETLPEGGDGGGHYYHFFNFPPTGEWHQVIVDTHPNHFRGAPFGDTEHGDLLHPTNEAGFNYFDLMTRFYLTFIARQLSHYPADFYVDGFELYRETRPENTAQIYSLNGVYVPASNTIHVGWMRDKREDFVNHEVRYAFEDIFAGGWDSATPAPAGLIAPPPPPTGGGGFNGMRWSTQAIDVSGKSVVYIAIKPQNSTAFRQIAIPIPPSSPSTVSVTRKPT